MKNKKTEEKFSNSKDYEKIERLRLSNEQSNKIARESLREAVVYLICEKGFDHISITELVARAGVSRATFYRNYQSKADLVEDIIEGLSAELKKILNKENLILDSRSLYLQFLNLCLEKKKIVGSIFSSNVAMQGLIPFLSIIENFKKPKNTNEHYKILAFEGAFFNILKGWVNSGFVESPNVMAELCCNMLRIFDVA